MTLLLIEIALAITLLTFIVTGCWLFRRAYMVCRVYSKGWAWCVCKTTKGGTVQGWVSVVQLRSIGSVSMIDMPAIKVKNKDACIDLMPTELDSIKEILGIFKVAWRCGGYEC